MGQMDGGAGKSAGHSLDALLGQNGLTTKGAKVDSWVYDRLMARRVTRFRGYACTPEEIQEMDHGDLTVLRLMMDAYEDA